MESDNIKWLTSVPATDINFKIHLKEATTEEIKEALSILKAKRTRGCLRKSGHAPTWYQVFIWP